MSQFLGTIAGGALFGGGAGLLLVGNGRIAGISGIAHGVVRPARGEFAWRVVFLLGLLGAGAASAALLPYAFSWQRDLPLGRLVAAGLFIGIGARVANGCTSGHGICGVGRLSLRSVVALAVFTVAGALVHWVDVHVGGVSS